MLVNCTCNLHVEHVADLCGYGKLYKTEYGDKEILKQYNGSPSCLFVFEDTHTHLEHFWKSGRVYEKLNYRTLGNGLGEQMFTHTNQMPTFHCAPLCSLLPPAYHWQDYTYKKDQVIWFGQNLLA